MLVPLVTFVALASPASFKMTRRFIGEWVAGPEGLATIPGLLLHAIVFMFLVKFLTSLLGRRENFETRKEQQKEEYSLWMQRNELVKV